MLVRKTLTFLFFCSYFSSADANETKKTLKEFS